MILVWRPLLHGETPKQRLNSVDVAVDAGSEQVGLG
jgi:hypothetical protein